MSRDFINKYFGECIEYPDNIAEDPVPIGTYYEYVSNSFLNGFINYVEVRKAFVLGRYTPWDKEISPVDILNPSGSLTWQKLSGTKDHIFTIATERDRLFHTCLSMFEDDVVILAKPKHSVSKQWWVFWFDFDVSDCCVGRFITDFTDEIVVQDFKEWVCSKDDNDYGPRELPLYAITGWVSF